MQLIVGTVKLMFCIVLFVVSFLAGEGIEVC